MPYYRLLISKLSQIAIKISLLGRSLAQSKPVRNSVLRISQQLPPWKIGFVYRALKDFISHK
jgi:hypothetical protein